MAEWSKAADCKSAHSHEFESHPPYSIFATLYSNISGNLVEMSFARNRKGKERGSRKSRLSHRIRFKIIAHILFTRHNTSIAISNQKGNVYSYRSIGNITDLKKRKRAIPVASNFLACDVGKYLRRKRMHHLYLRFKGNFRKRFHVVRGFTSMGITIKGFAEKTGIPYNGTRKRHLSRR